MAELLYDEFDVLVSTYITSRALRSHGWTKKVARRMHKKEMRTSEVTAYINSQRII